MTVTAALLLDIVLLLILALFFVQGIRRGFILTLCSLLAVFLALAGGWFLAVHYVQPVQEALVPVILERLLPEEQKEEDAQESLMDPVQKQMEDAIQAVQTEIITRQAEAMAGILARALLFLAGFVGVLAVWIILCRALDLVARLPGLHFVNKALGGFLGLVKGLVICLLLRWVLCDVFRLIPTEVAEESYLLTWLSSIRLLPLITQIRTL